MKRTLTGIAAASMVLGLTVPAAFAATSHTNYNQRTISIGSYSAGLKGIAAKDPWSGSNTEFMPIYYLQQGLKALGYTATWDGTTHTLAITTSSGSTTGLTKVTPGNGTVITINGVPVVNAPKTLVAKDPASGKWTSYLPIYYLADALKALGYTSSYNGAAGTWTVASAVKLAVTGAPTSSVAIGQKVTLGLTNNGTAVTSGVTWSASGGVVDQMGNFVASAAGTYTVTASYDGQTATSTVAVYGAATAVKLTAASSNVVANGISTDVVTAQVVDANGTPVQDYTGNLTLAYATNGNNGATQLPSLTTVAAVNGQATFTLTATGASGRTDALSVSGNDALGNPLTAGTTSITSVAQVATSIQLTAAQSKVPDNSATPDSLSATVEDQTGNPMLTGAYQLSFAVSGPGTLSTTTSSGYGNGTMFVPATVSVTSEQGVAGDITVTASYNGLTSGTASITSQAAGVPAKIVLSGPTTNPTAGSPATVTATLEDANGVPVAAGTSGQAFTVTASDTSSVITNTGSESFAAGQSTTTFTVTDNTAEVDTLTAAATGLSSGTVGVTYLAGTPSALALTPSSALNVPANNPATNLSVQLQDANANNVAQAGVKVDFYLVTAPAGGHTATLDGVSSSNTTATTQTLINGGNVTPWATATTNAQGVATVPFVPQGYANDGWVLAAYVPAQGSQAAIAPQEYTVNVTNAVGSVITSSVTNSSAQQVSQTTAGAQTDFNFWVKDANGNPVSNETVTLTVSNPNAVSSTAPTITNGTVGTSAWNATTGTITATTDSNGEVTLNFGAGSLVGAGNFSVTAVDTSSSTAPSTTASVTVTPSTTVTGFGVWNAAGQLVDYSNGEQAAATISNYTAANAIDASNGSLQTFTVKPVDAYGNPVVATQGQFIQLTDGSAAASTGYFRTSTNGNNVSVVYVPAGTSSVTLYYGNTSTSATAEELEATLDNPTIAHATSGTVTLTFGSGTIANNATLTPADFTVYDNTANAAVTVSKVAASSDVITLSTGSFTAGDTLTVTYNGSGTSNLAYTNATPVPSFSVQG